MEKEELKAEEKTSESEAPQTKEEESSEEKKSESAEGGQEKEIDYEAELKKLQEERDNYKEGMLTYKSKLKDKQDDENEEEYEEEAKKEDIDEKLSEFKADIVKDNIEAILDSLTSNQAERKLIKWHYDNSIKHSGYDRINIRKNLEIAQTIANKQKISIEKEELERSIDLNYSNSGYGSSVNKKIVNKNRELTPQELGTFVRINQRRKVNKRPELTKEEFIKMLESNK